jgi:hypothetical protein
MFLTFLKIVAIIYNCVNFIAVFLLARKSKHFIEDLTYFVIAFANAACLAVLLF